jgi:hypothetical protein
MFGDVMGIATSKRINALDRLVGKGGRMEDPKDWQRGFDAGREGKPFIYPSDVKELFAWTSGYIEGKRSTLDQTAWRARPQMRERSS